MTEELSEPADDGPLLVVDGTGTVRSWTARAERVFGRTAAQALGRPAIWATSSRDLALRVRPRMDRTGTGAPSGEGGKGADPAGELHWAVDLAEEPGAVVWDAAVLDALFGQSPVGLHVLDPDLCVVRVNTGAGTRRQEHAEEFVGRRFDEVYRLVEPAEQEAVARRILATGVPTIERTVRGFEDEDRTRERLYSVSGFRLHATDGRVLGLALVVVDRTEHERAKVLADLLAAERERVGRTLDVVATCQDLADTLTPGFADRAEVEIADPVIRGAEPPVPDSASATLLRCAAVAGAPVEDGDDPTADSGGTPLDDGAREGRGTSARGGDEHPAAGDAEGTANRAGAGSGHGSDGGERPPRTRGGPDGRNAGCGVNVVSPLVGEGRDAETEGRDDGGAVHGDRVGEARVLHGPSPETLALADLQPRLLDLRAGTPVPDDAKGVPHGAHSLLVVPLSLRGGALGLLTLYRVGTSEPFLTDEVATATEIAAHATLAIDNARRYAHERALAATVQRRLLPQWATEPPLGVRTAHTYLPGAEGGGAWYDVIPLSGACSALVVGEVAGDGIHAATAMGQVRTAVRAFSTLGIEPDELLARLDETVSQLASERRALPAHDPLRDQPLTVACAYAVYDAGEGICTVARAGGADPWLAGPDGLFAPLGAPDGPVLGDPDVTPFACLSVELSERSTLVMPASAEARVGRALRETVAPGSVQEVCDVLAHAGETGRPGGDTVFLAARTTALPRDTSASWPLDLDEQAPARARGLADAWLADRVGSESVFKAELVVSELVTNAVRYGTPPVSLALILGRVLTVEVKDSSPTSPHLRHARTLDESGRGLLIVAQLTDRWGTRHTPHGKTIWAETSRG